MQSNLCTLYLSPLSITSTKSMRDIKTNTHGEEEGWWFRVSKHKTNKKEEARQKSQSGIVAESKCEIDLEEEKALY